MSSFRKYFVAFAAVSLVQIAAWGAWLGWGPGASAGRRTAALFWAFSSIASLGASVAAARATADGTDRTVKSLQERVWANEEMYLQEKSKFDTLLADLPDGIVITNLRGEVLYINAAAMTALRVRREDIFEVGRDSTESIRQDRVRFLVQDILEKRTTAEVVEIPMEGPDGPTVRYYQVSVALFSVTSDKNIGVMMILRDRTLDRQMSRMKEEFFRSVAHDLRAPLGAIQGYVRLLEKRLQLDDKSRSFVTAIYRSCDKLTLFIQDILDASRLEAGQLALKVGPVDAASLFQRLRTLYGPVAEEKGVRIESRLPRTSPAVEGDERLLERVFHNLISNALRATPRGGTIRLCASEAGEGQVEFSVADSGPGIPKEMQALVFEKFNPMSAAGGRGRGGFGLGLHIARQIVELHRGKIWVVSTEGRGSELVFRIPVRQPSAVRA